MRAELSWPNHLKVSLNTADWGLKFNMNFGVDTLKP
jgi:hypothetical protein